MNQIYFVVRVDFDNKGQPIEGTERYISVLTDPVVIEQAESTHKLHLSRGRRTDKDIIKDGPLRVRSTLSEFPAPKDPPEDPGRYSFLFGDKR